MHLIKPFDPATYSCLGIDSEIDYIDAVYQPVVSRNVEYWY